MIMADARENRLALLPGVPLIESPFFDQWIDSAGLDSETRSLARQLHEHGYAIIDFPDPDILAIAAQIRARYPREEWSSQWKSQRDGSLRMIDGWQYDEDIRRIAANPRLIEILSSVYGRRAFPFQTLTFPLGTQQKPHSDTLHFNTHPERFMCAVWVALEDTDSDNGPLVYYPGSHRWPIVGNAQMGYGAASPDAMFAHYAQFQRTWEAIARVHGVELARFRAKAGQALIWTANLLHGGDLQKDMTRSRYSQATHYFFEGCVYYTPLLSEPFAGTTYFREPTDIASGGVVQNVVAGSALPRTWLETVSPAHKPSVNATPKAKPTALPSDFDASGYLRLNPDVAGAGVDAATHYLQFGWNENRRWR